MKASDTLTRKASGVITRSAKASGALAAVSLGALQPRRGGRNGTVHAHKDRCQGKPHTWLYGTENAVCSVCGKTVPKGMATGQPDPKEVAGPRQYPEWITYVWHQDHEHTPERHVLRDVVRNANVLELVAVKVSYYGEAASPSYRWQLLQDPEANGHVTWNNSRDLAKAKGQARAALERWKHEQASKSGTRVKSKAKSKWRADRKAEALAQVEANRQVLLAHNLKQVLTFGVEEVRKMQAKERRRVELNQGGWHWMDEFSEPGAATSSLRDPQRNKLAEVRMDLPSGGYRWKLLKSKQTGWNESNYDARREAEAAAKALEWRLVS